MSGGYDEALSGLDDLAVEDESMEVEEDHEEGKRSPEEVMAEIRRLMVELEACTG